MHPALQPTGSTPSEEVSPSQTFLNSARRNIFTRQIKGQGIDTNTQVQNPGPSPTLAQSLVKVLQSSLEVQQLLHHESSQQLGEIFHTLKISKPSPNPKPQEQAIIGGSTDVTLSCTSTHN